MTREQLEEVAALPADLLAEAAGLIKRPVEVTVTIDGRFVVLYLNGQGKAPPVRATALEALSAFITEKKEALANATRTEPAAADV